MKHTKHGRAWLQEHVNDRYVKQAKQTGYRARSAFKLLEIQQKDRILKPGMTVVDLGAAPGGWSQVAVQQVGKHGQVIALDILPMEPIADVTILQGDFREPDILGQLQKTLNGANVDLVISDMAPNISGMAAIDQPRAMLLAELAFDFAQKNLKPGGHFLVKVFQGAGFPEYLRTLRQHFKRVVTRKPDASRARSREMYLLGKEFNPAG